MVATRAPTLVQVLVPAQVQGLVLALVMVLAAAVAGGGVSAGGSGSAPERAGICHCMDCRKHHGAPFYAAAIFCAGYAKWLPDLGMARGFERDREE